MKKIYSLRKSVLPFLFLAVMAVACGLRITKVEFSTHEPEQNSTLTVTATLAANGDNNEDDYYLLYAIRVPNDWAGEKLNVKLETGDIEMIECESYAKFCDYCYPREGYKWVGYQSKEVTKQSHNITAAVDLKVGMTMGDFTLDIMGGGWKKDPANLLKDGEINLELAFGNNLDFTEPATNKNEAAGIQPSVFHSSEYLFNTTTITEAECNARKTAMSSAHNLTAYGMTMPIAPDVANIAEKEGDKPVLNMNVTVKAGAGVANVAVDAENGEAEYFDLHGRKVANPENGLYLVKRGNTVTKEIVK